MIKNSLDSNNSSISNNNKKFKLVEIEMETDASTDNSDSNHDSSVDINSLRNLKLIDLKENDLIKLHQS